MNLWEKRLNKEDLNKAMKSLSNYKSLRNDGLGNFMKYFGMILLKESYIRSIKQALHKKTLSTSKSQATHRKKFVIKGM